MSKKVNVGPDGKPQKKKKKSWLEKVIPKGAMRDMAGAKERLIRIETKLDYLIEKMGHVVPIVDIPKNPGEEDELDQMEDAMDMITDMAPPPED